MASIDVFLFFPETSPMRFWLTLIISTVILSAGLTALTLYRGAQTITPLPPPPQDTTKPELLFALEPGQEQSANGIEVKLPPVKVGTQHTFTVKGRNKKDNSGDLTLRLIRTLPEADFEVRCNGQVMKKMETVTIKPGESCEITLKWTVGHNLAHAQKPDGYHFRAEIDWNDHRYDEPLMIEAIAKIEH
jgi:hypothetical protein